MHNVATNEGSKTNNEVLDKTEDAIDDIEMTKESVQEYQEDDNADIDLNDSLKPVEKTETNINSNEENNEDLLVRPIRNLAESTDILTDPFPEYENISFDENSKQNANLIPTEENHKFAEENVVIKEGSKTANDAIVQSDENASIKSSSSKCPICKKVFIGKVSFYNLRRHIGNVHGEDPDEFEKELVQESPKANEFNLTSPVQENHKTTEDEMAPESKELREEDNICDREFNALLVGKIVCANYVSGLAKGTVKYFNRKLDKYLLGFEDGSTDLFQEKDVDDVEMWFEDSPRNRVTILPKLQKTAKDTSSYKLLFENNLFNPNNSDTIFEPTDKTHEKLLESKIANLNEQSGISSNYENCKVCKVRILFKHINIHMKAKHPSSFEYQKIPRRSFQKWLG